MMDSYNTKNWPSLLQDAVKLLNARHMQRNAGVTPSEVTSMVDDVLIQDAKAEAQTGNSEVEDPISSDIANQYDASKNFPFKPETFVYLDRKHKTLEKSFGKQVRRLFLLFMK